MWKGVSGPFGGQIEFRRVYRPEFGETLPPQACAHAQLAECENFKPRRTAAAGFLAVSQSMN